MSISLHFGADEHDGQGNPEAQEIPKHQETVLKQLWADHGMEIVGPPLKF